MISLEISQAVQILMDYKDIFSKSDIFMSAIRAIGWWILGGLKSILDAILEGFKTVFQVVTFSNSEIITDFLGQYKAIIPTLMTLSLVIIGILMIYGSNIRGGKLLQNIGTGLAVLMLLPIAGNSLNTLTLNYADSQIKAIDMGASDILAQNAYDLKYIFQDENYAENYENRNYFLLNDNAEAIWDIDINEQIIGNEDDSGVYDVFNKVYDPAFPDQELEIDPTSFVVQIDFLTPWYYRYSVDMIPIMIIYIVYMIVIIATMLRCARLAYEIIVHNLLATVLAATDLAGGNRLKEVLKSLLSTYVVLMYAATAIVIFNLFMQWLLIQDYPLLVTALITLGIARAVIDGPVLRQRIVGIDAGVRSGFHTMLTTWALTRGAVRTVSHAGHRLAGWSKRKEAPSPTNPGPGSGSPSSPPPSNGAPSGGAESSSKQYSEASSQYKESRSHSSTRRRQTPGSAAIPNSNTKNSTAATNATKQVVAENSPTIAKEPKSALGTPSAAKKAELPASEASKNNLAVPDPSNREESMEMPVAENQRSNNTDNLNEALNTMPVSGAAKPSEVTENNAAPNNTSYEVDKNTQKAQKVQKTKGRAELRKNITETAGEKQDRNTAIKPSSANKVPTTDNVSMNMPHVSTSSGSAETSTHISASSLSPAAPESSPAYEKEPAYRLNGQKMDSNGMPISADEVIVHDTAQKPEVQKRQVHVYRESSEPIKPHNHERIHIHEKRIAQNSEKAKEQTYILNGEKVNGNGQKISQNRSRSPKTPKNNARRNKK